MYAIVVFSKSMLKATTLNCCCGVIFLTLGVDVSIRSMVFETPKEVHQARAAAGMECSVHGRTVLVSAATARSFLQRAADQRSPGPSCAPGSLLLTLVVYYTVCLRLDGLGQLGLCLVP
jgi:hypothetical protein